MRGTTRTVAIAGVSALALLTAACSGDSGGATLAGRKPAANTATHSPALADSRKKMDFWMLR